MTIPTWQFVAILAVMAAMVPGPVLPAIIIVVSVFVIETAFICIAVAKSLASTAASLPAGPDIPGETTGVDAVTDQPVSTCNTIDARNFLSRVDA